MVKSVLQLLDDLESEDPGIRVAAAEALGSLGTDAPVVSLRVALGDSRPAVRRAAASALAKSASPAALEGLVQASEDQDEGVREEAGEGLERIGGMQIADWISDEEGDEQDGEAYYEALRAIARRRGAKYLDGVFDQIILGAEGRPVPEGEYWGPWRQRFNLMEGLVELEWADRILRGDGGFDSLVEHALAHAGIESGGGVGVGPVWSLWTFERNGMGFVVSETDGETESYYFIVAAWRPGDNPDVRFECVAQALEGDYYGFFGWEEPSWWSSFSPEQTSTLAWRVIRPRPHDWEYLVSEVKLSVEVDREEEEWKRLEEKFTPSSLAIRLEVPEETVERVLARLEDGSLDAGDLTEDDARVLVDLFAHLAFD